MFLWLYLNTYKFVDLFCLIVSGIWSDYLVFLFGVLKLFTFNVIIDMIGFKCTCLLFVREGNGNPLQYSCLENPTDGGAWQAAVHEVAKSQTQLNYFTFTFHFHALEKEMATHSSVLALRIPGTGEPGVLLSMGSHGVGDD